jgi:O-antigen/teichoic acid export membrane protein
MWCFLISYFFPNLLVKKAIVRGGSIWKEIHDFGVFMIMRSIKLIKSFFKKISRSIFLRNVLIMVTGTASAQLVSLLMQPFITRLYGPEAFGVMGVFMAFIGILTPVAALTYPIAIVLSENDYEAKRLIKLSLIVTIINTLIISVFVLFIDDLILSIFNIEEISAFLYLIPFVILLAGVLQVLEQWLIRNKQFKVTAKVTVIQSIFLNGSKVGVGLFYPAASALIIINVLGMGIKALLMQILGEKHSNKRNKIEIGNPLSLRELIKKYKDFPLFRAPEVLLSAISQSLPILMLTTFFGPASAGFYSLSKTVLLLPTNLIGKSVGDVFYPKISEASRNGENIHILILKATLGLFVIGIIPFGIIIIFGPGLFSWIFGADWLMAGEYARWISLGIFFSFINKPSIKALPVLNAQSFHLKYTILILIIQIAVLFIGYYIFSSDLVSIALFGLSGAILNVLLILITIRLSKRKY